MLLVNQANDQGEITGSGVADSVAYDAKDRIEVITGWNSDVDIDVERLNSYRGQLGAYQQHTGASRGFLVLMTPGKVITA
jgi:exodeoxyribonuclease-5